MNLVGVEVLENPGFFITYGAIQLVVLLLLVRLLDPFERLSLGVLALMAVWGATGAAVIALAGNEAVMGLLKPDERDVYGDVVSAPLVEESAKGLALLAVLVVSLWLAKRNRALTLKSLSAWLACGAAVGLGFSFTEDLFYFVNRTGQEGVQAGADLFLGRRDFFGPTALHHPLFTAAFGAGIGLAVWSRSLWAKIGFPLLGFAVAVLMHAVNNGLVELIIVVRHGLDAATAWVNDAAVARDVQTTADVSTAALVVLDYVWLIGFLLAIALWQRYQRRVIQAELEAEVENGVVTESDRDAICTPLARPRLYWRLLRTGRFDRLGQLRALHNEEASLALLKWQADRFGADRKLVAEQRRRVVATASIGEHGGAFATPSTGLIGRETALSELEGLLTSSESRVVTMTGPGGTGKTRLALELASRLEERFAGGAYFVDLSPIEDPAHVPGAVARELELTEAVGDEVDRLSDYLRDKQLLLVLDNFEQVSGAATAVRTIAEAATRVRMLVTSRTALRIGGESEYALPPLSLERPGGATGDSPALELFLERARSAAPSFEPGPEDREAARAICERLDGLPLAIELAAARIGTLSPRAILRRIDAQSELPGQVRPDLPDRHRSLEATVRWSEQLLDQPSRQLFHRISIFPAGCRADGAWAVFDEAPDEEALLDQLTGLREASLLFVRPDPDGEPRFRMLETIRDYAAEQLEAPVRSEVEEAAADYVLARARELAPALAGPEPEEANRRLDSEHENLLAAVAWLRRSGKERQAASLLTAIAVYWERGHIADVVPVLASLVEGDTALDTASRASATRLLGRLSLLSGRYAEADALLDSVVEAPQLTDRERIQACWDAGWSKLFRGEFDLARASFQKGLSLSEMADDQAALGQSIANLGRVLAEQGELATAHELLGRSLEIRTASGDIRGVTSSLSALGRVELLQSDLDKASGHLEEALATARRLEDGLRTAESLYPLSLLALARGDRNRCAELSLERLEICRTLGDALGIAESLEVLAESTDGDRNGEASASLLGGASGIRESIGADPWPSDRDRVQALRERLTESLGRDRLEAAVARGRTMKRAELHALARSFDPEAAA